MSAKSVFCHFCGRPRELYAISFCAKCVALFNAATQCLKNVEDTINRDAVQLSPGVYLIPRNLPTPRSELVDKEST
jgi:hypothetical protein